MMEICGTMALYNRISRKELKKKLLEETLKRITISFYCYFPVPEPYVFRNEMYQKLEPMQVFGRIYIAREGINAQISVPEHEFGNFRNYLYTIPPLNGLRLNIAVDDDGKSFWMLKIKVRSKIVADGISDPDFDMTKKGRYVDAPTFNRMADDPETIIVDMRNHYEYEVGHFENAIEVPSETFREQLPMTAEMLKDKKDRNIIMYCTGGIRCEKASAYLRHRGFENVYHLEGGVIHYANTAKENNLPNKFLGRNFVFDQRLGERVGDEIISHCHQCGRPCDTHVNCGNESCHLLFIQCPDCAEKYKGCCSAACCEINELPEATRKTLRKGLKNGRKIFNNKSRKRMDALKNEE